MASGPRRLVASLALIAAGCGPADERSAESATAVDTAHAPRPDSALIVVTGPTLVVFYPGAYAAVDSGGDVAEEIGDQQYHLGTARPALDSLGVTVYERYGGSIEYLHRDGMRGAFTPSRDSARAGYLFLHPGTAAHVHYGVLTHIDMMRAVRSRFDLQRDAAGR